MVLVAGVEAAAGHKADIGRCAVIDEGTASAVGVVEGIDLGDLGQEDVRSIDLGDEVLAAGVGGVGTAAPVVEAVAAREHGAAVVGLVELAAARGDDDIALGGSLANGPAGRGLCGRRAEGAVVGAVGSDVGGIDGVDDVPRAVGAADELPVAGHSGRRVSPQFSSGTGGRHIAGAAQGCAEGVVVVLRGGAGQRLVDGCGGEAALEGLEGRREGADLSLALGSGEGALQGGFHGGDFVQQRRSCAARVEAHGRAALTVYVGLDVADGGDDAVDVAVEALDGRVGDAFEGVAPFGVGEHEGEHPFVQADIAGADVGQLDEYLVPPGLEVDGHGGAGGEVLVLQIHLAADALAAVGPGGRCHLGAVDPDARALAVPRAGVGCLVVLRAAVVLELDEGTGGLCHRRIDVSPGVGRGVQLRVTEEGRHGGAPYVAQVDGTAGGHAGSVGLTVVGVLVGQHVGRTLFGREDGAGRAAVGEGLRDAPLDVGLPDVGNALVLQPCTFII